MSVGSIVNHLTVSHVKDVISEGMSKHGYTDQPFRAGLILGSGLGSFGKDYIEDPVTWSFNDLFRRVRMSVVEGEVPGHQRKIIVGQLKGAPDDCLVIAQSGREHPYEGVTAHRATFWLRVMQAFGVPNLIVSNAAGILTPDTLDVPSLMLAHSMLDLDPRYNPLLGTNEVDRQSTAWGPRFPHMGDQLTSSARTLIKRIAAENGIALKEGTYMRVLGPNYESPETVYWLRRQLKDIFAEGRDDPRFVGDPTGVVGMSTTYEHLVAQHASQAEKYRAFDGARIAISACTNYAAGLGRNGVFSFPSHQEVGDNARILEADFGRLVQQTILNLPVRR